jgi:hypothetical protein
MHVYIMGLKFLRDICNEDTTRTKRRNGSAEIHNSKLNFYLKISELPFSTESWVEPHRTQSVTRH